MPKTNILLLHYIELIDCKSIISNRPIQLINLVRCDTTFQTQIKYCAVCLFIIIIMIMLLLFVAVVADKFVPRNKCTTNRPNHRVIWYANINNWKHLQNDILYLHFFFLAFSFAFHHFTFILLNGSNYICEIPSLPLFFSKISISFQSFSYVCDRVYKLVW